MNPIELYALELRAELDSLRKRLQQLAQDWEQEAEDDISYIKGLSLRGCASELRQTLEGGGDE